ncbi:MAG TPA: alpha-1,4-glucan--maltose-1-phosphate maltosyltransferase [Polyangiaceae bacterium]
MKQQVGTLPRVVIEGVSPQIDAGRYPVKRCEGDRVLVEADIFKDGHDLIAARVVFRGPADETWKTARLDFQFDLDRWFGEFSVDRLGSWEFTIEAWPDHYGTWRSDLGKRVAAGQDVRAELLEGALLLHKAAAAAAGEVRVRLQKAAAALANAEADVETRVRVALADALLDDSYGPHDAAELTRFERVLSIVVDRKVAGFGAWYELFPRSETSDARVHGTFQTAERRLPAIAAQGFDVLYLPPIHPIGVTHRKGKNNARVAEPGDVGSPWAIGGKEGGHDAIHPDLGTLAEFDRFVAAAERAGLQVALDFALQCSPDHPWVKQHPEWFFIRPDNTIRYAENPPKKYEDIYPLNFWCKDRAGLWNACRDVLLHWIEHGVRTFRVDNPHTKPLAFWEWVIAEIKRRHPDVIFLAEAFTRPKRMRSLAKLGFTQSYTYFTWKNSAAELKEYLTELTRSEMAEYYRPNFFANTPDILHEYLQEGGRPAFRIRLLLAATLAPVYGLYSGYELCENVPVRPGSEEYLDSEKYQVKVRDWDAPGNLSGEITRINQLRRENAALQQLANLSFLDSEFDGILAFRKSAPGNDLLVIVNLDPHRPHETMVSVPLAELGLSEDVPFEVEDLLSGARYTWRGARNYVRLDPMDKVGHILRLVR